MKIFKRLLYCSTILCAAIFSCSKETGKTIPDPIDAMYDTYTGKKGDGVSAPGSFLQLKLEEHGSLLSFSNSKSLTGLGEWKLNGRVFTGTFRQTNENINISLSGTYDPEQHTITGSWGFGEFTIGGGSFYLVKQADGIVAAKNKPADVLLDRYF